MSCSDYPTAQTAKTFKLDAETLNEVVTSTSDLTSPASDGKQKTTLEGINTLAEKQREQFNDTFQAQFAYKRIGNISDYVGDTLTEADKLNSYQHPDDSKEWYGPIQSQTFPITIPADPSAHGSGWALVTAATQGWVEGKLSEKADDINAPYVITTKKNQLQMAVDEAVNRKYDDYKQINGSSNSGSVIIDLGGGVAKIDRPIELPSGAGGYTFANGIIAPDASNFPNGENLIEYVGNGDHPLIGYQNLQLECSRIANGIYANRYIENFATSLRIHGQKDHGIRIGSGSAYEFSFAPGCQIAEFYNGEDGQDSPTSVGLLIDVGDGADNKFNGLVVKYCKKQVDIGSQANQFTSCHFYGAGSGQYGNDRSVIRANAKRNKFMGVYWDTCGLNIQNPSKTQIIGGGFASGSAVDGSSYVHFEMVTPNNFVDALMIKNQLFTLIGDYSASAFSWSGNAGRIRDTEVYSNAVDIQNSGGSIKMHSTRAFKRVFASGSNSATATFNDVLLFDLSIQRIIDSEVELTNTQPHNTQISGKSIIATLPAGEFANITLRTSVDISDRSSSIADQYPL